MTNLPGHGRIICATCHNDQQYCETRTELDGWRITNNPLSWGSTSPDVVVLGFSKGPTQAGALSNGPHDEIAFRGGRSNVAKILHHIGLIEAPSRSIVDRLIADKNGQFHFGSLIRCTVERYDRAAACWKGTGGGMLDRFMASELGHVVSRNCAERFLGVLPQRTRLVVMMGLGTNGNYVSASRRLFELARPGHWREVNDVAYADDHVVVVHTEHFASQGSLLPNWLSSELHPRGRLGLLARQAVNFALSR